MRASVFIIIFVFGIHFFFKAVNYSGMIKTTGVVVGHGHLSYGTIRGRGHTVPYPVVAFKYNREVPREVDMGEAFHQTDWSKATAGNLDEELERKMTELGEQNTDTPGILHTVEPEGAMFYRNYRHGEILSVIYDPEDPEHAIVHTFFSYWLTLKAMAFLPAVCVALIGFRNVMRMR